MRRMLVVDDERIERNGIKMLIRKMNLPLEVIEASNGKEAYRMLADGKEKVDLLLTDVKMPFMSGLDLVREIHPLLPNMQIAIFSGFGEFEYAKEAMKFGVKDYILKPVNPAEFEQTIRRMLEACEQQELKADQDRDQKAVIVKHWMIRYLYTGKPEYLEKLSQPEMVCEFQKRVLDVQNMMLLEIDNLFLEERTDELIRRLEEEFHREIGCINLDSHQVLLLFGKSANNNYERIAGVISKILREEYEQKSYIAVSRPVEDAKLYPQIYQELDMQMENKFYHSDITVFPYDFGVEEAVLGSEQVDYLSGMKESIRLKDVMHIWDNFEKLQSQIHDESQYSQMYTKFVFSEFIKEVYEQMNAMGSVQMIEKIEAIYRAMNISQVILIVKEAILEFEKSCLQSEQGARSDIDQVKQYIMYHVNEDLSVEKLAAKVYLSQGHLSYLFKKETGMNLSRYIKECRMEAAQKLLRETNMKIVQVCEKVGFSNVSYFCQSFREYCGVSPERYRKGEGVDEA